MHFAYQAVTPSSRIITEVVQADSAAELKKKLERDGLQVIDVHVDARATLRHLFKASQIKRTVLIDLFAQMNGLLELGMNVNASISSVIETTDDKMLRDALMQISDGVEKGYSLREAVQNTNMFPSLVIASIDAAERSNRLQEVFKELAEHYREMHKLVSNAKKAATYPLISVAVLLIVMLMMLLVVVPQLKGVLPENPPLPTRIMFFLSDSLSVSLWIVPILIVAAWQTLKRLTPEQRDALWKVLYRAPLFGRLALDVELASFFMNLAMLNGGGIPVLDTLPIAMRTTSSSYVAEKVRYCHELAAQGGKLSDGFRDPIFPPIVSRAIIHGETTGRFDQQFIGLAKFLRDRTNARIELLSTLIEPMLMLVGGGLILLMALSIFMPLYGQIQKFGH